MIAPPESRNLTDPVFHQSVSSAVHFLPYPSLEELQMSKLATYSSRPYHTICFPPRIHFLDANNPPPPGRPPPLGRDIPAFKNIKIVFTCSTSNVSFKYWFDSESASRSRLYSPSNPPVVPRGAHYRVLASSHKLGLRNSRPTMRLLMPKSSSTGAAAVAGTVAAALQRAPAGMAAHTTVELRDGGTPQAAGPAGAPGGFTGLFLGALDKKRKAPNKSSGGDSSDVSSNSSGESEDDQEEQTPPLTK
eukprot:GHVT01100571.1.p1 GENE.GHVT01100571.1~~GHVT01100571.1.p1  ORF type:complete len:247 (+),score=33.76 GHVT01100571.1:1736-2476(+)